MIQRCALCGRTGLDVESRIVADDTELGYHREPRCVDEEACRDSWIEVADFDAAERFSAWMNRQDEYRVIETVHIIPTPALAGWTEETRLAELERFKAGIRAEGGVVVIERRIRNTAFDGPGERTTFTLKVKWA